jgi:hypothetical protein
MNRDMVPLDVAKDLVVSGGFAPNIVLRLKAIH